MKQEFTWWSLRNIMPGVCARNGLEHGKPAGRERLFSQFLDQSGPFETGHRTRYRERKPDYVKTCIDGGMDNHG